MEGKGRLGATLCAVSILCTAVGGCIHSDTARSGVVDGRFWCERVADDVSEPYINELRSELMALGPEVSGEEASILADVSVRHADFLRRQWGIVKPIELHNVLVNVGLRQRGLCYQCAEAMYERLHGLKLETFDLHWGVAHKGDLWLEHSGVIVTARGRPFSEGLVVDAWRHSGRLRWSRVRDDRYPWQEMIKWKYPDAVRLARAAAAQPDTIDGADAGDGDAQEAAQRVDSRAENRAGTGRASPAEGSSKQLSTMVTTRLKEQWP